MRPWRHHSSYHFTQVQVILATIAFVSPMRHRRAHNLCCVLQYLGMKKEEPPMGQTEDAIMLQRGQLCFSFPIGCKGWEIPGSANDKFPDEILSPSCPIESTAIPFLAYQPSWRLSNCAKWSFRLYWTFYSIGRMYLNCPVPSRSRAYSESVHVEGNEDAKKHPRQCSEALRG